MEEILEEARKVLRTEAQAIWSLVDRLEESFIRAVEHLAKLEGKIIFIGIGKSGLISKKIASTFLSCGIPSFFLHPAEGLHGDVGMITREDIVIAISNSGETEEILRLLPLIKRRGNLLIAITGNLESNLAKTSDLVIEIKVKEEACPFGFIPTASTTATLAMGDALAICVLKKKGFKEEDFAQFHPGGTIGKRLFLRVADLMHTGKKIPLVEEEESMKKVLLEMTSKRLGVTGILNSSGQLIGIITDGDLRRAMERYEDLLTKSAREIMTANPKTIDAQSLAAKALQRMEEFAITALFVLNEEKRGAVEGIIHMHDLIRAGIA